MAAVCFLGSTVYPTGKTEFHLLLAQTVILFPSKQLLPELAANLYSWIKAYISVYACVIYSPAPYKVRMQLKCNLQKFEHLSQHMTIHIHRYATTLTLLTTLLLVLANQNHK